MGRMVGREALRDLVVELAEIEGHRTPVGWNTAFAMRRATVERKLIARITCDVSAPTTLDTVVCHAPLMIKTVRAHLQLDGCRVVEGGLFIEARVPLAVGEPVHVAILDDTAQWIGARGRVGWRVGSPKTRGYGLHLNVDLSANDERRRRRFILQLVAHAIPNV